MSDLNNIFWFGKKELTQDSMLMWIVKNGEEEELKDVARDFLGYFALGRQLKDNETITNVRGMQQYKDIDVAIEFYLESPEKSGWYYLIIEDKTYSYIHGYQITKYLLSAFKEYEGNWHKTNRKNTHIRMVYVKTMPLNEYDETEPWIEADLAESKFGSHPNATFNPKEDAVVFDLKKLYELILCHHLESKNQILKDYCCYMRDRYMALVENNKEGEDVSCFFVGFPDVWDIRQDERKIERSNIFFSSLFKEFGDSIGHSEFWWCQYDYFFFKHYRDNRENQNLPIIEIRSRDFSCVDNKISIQVHLANYTAFFDKMSKENRQAYLSLTHGWANYLKENYDGKNIGKFIYFSSSRTGDQKQLGILSFEKEGSMSSSELFGLLNNLMEIQEQIDCELDRIR